MEEEVCGIDSLGDEVVGWFITCGVVLSFIPQIVTLVQRKTPDGLSVVSWTFNYVSNFATFLNILILQWRQMMCCKHLPPSQCTAKLLPQIQLFGPWMSTLVIFILLAVYTRGYTKPKFEFDENESLVGRVIERFFEDYSYSGPLFFLAMLLTILSTIIGISMVLILGPASPHIQRYGDSFGIIAVVMLFVQYIPQIYTTHKHRESGSLSIVSLLIQAPGALVVVYFQAVISHSKWTTWAPYFCSALQQLFLVCLCLYYHVKDKHKKKNENMPLLGETQIN